MLDIELVMKFNILLLFIAFKPVMQRKNNSFIRFCKIFHKFTGQCHFDHSPKIFLR